MIPYESALALVLENTAPPAQVEWPLSHAEGYVLSEAVTADEPVPTYDSSAMDGFAVLLRDVEGATEDAPRLLAVQGEVRPGTSPVPDIESGSALRIFTGSPVPENTETIVIKEHTEDLGGEVRIKAAAGPDQHIRRCGEEFAPGDLVFPAGTRITPPVVGMLASLGRVRVQVHPKPVVAVVTTGDELQPPEAQLKPGQVRNANAFSLSAALVSMGMSPPRVWHARDREEDTEEALSQALEHGDVVLTVGGVSVGKYDFVKKTLERLRVKEIFWRVAMKPGKPNFFGKRGGQLVFGLPGNPVSVLVSFHLLVRPALRKLQGLPAGEPTLCKARLREDLKKRPGRFEMVRGRLHRLADGTLEASAMRGQGSHMLGNLALADGFIHFPADRERLEAGSIVEVEPMFWSES